MRVPISGLMLVIAVAALHTPAGYERYVEERDGIEYNGIKHRASDSKLSFVNNSGICETTPGVNQHSGYFSVGEGQNMWFWFFEARTNPQEAPLIAYFGGGPGAASEYGLFTQHGPCRFVNNETEPSLNPYSFNTNANMLYIDQPVATGFSYGEEPVNSTKSAAPFVWNLLQAFLATFPEYQDNEFGILTESYGGHYGPEFARYVLARNAAIVKGDAQGAEINITSLAITNGWFDAGIQERTNIEFAHHNEYRQIINDTFYEELLRRYNNISKPAIDKCAATGTEEDCFAAWNSYINQIEFSILGAARELDPNFDLADVRASPMRPPTAHVRYLQRPDIQKALGARSNYTDSIGAGAFIRHGDDARSFVGELSEVVRAGVKVLIWTGDVDTVCNWVGTLEVADTADWSGRQQFAGETLEPYSLNGVQKGTFKSLDTLSYMRTFGAGHNLIWYQPEVSLQIWQQFLGTGVLVST